MLSGMPSLGRGALLLSDYVLHCRLRARTSRCATGSEEEHAPNTEGGRIGRSKEESVSEGAWWAWNGECSATRTSMTNPRPSVRQCRRTLTPYSTTLFGFRTSAATICVGLTLQTDTVSGVIAAHRWPWWERAIWSTRCASTSSPTRSFFSLAADECCVWSPADERTSRLAVVVGQYMPPNP